MLVQEAEEKIFENRVFIFACQWEHTLSLGCFSPNTLNIFYVRPLSPLLNQPGNRWKSENKKLTCVYQPALCWLFEACLCHRCRHKPSFVFVRNLCIATLPRVHHDKPAVFAQVRTYMQRDKIFNYFASFQHISSTGKQVKLLGQFQWTSLVQKLLRVGFGVKPKSCASLMGVRTKDVLMIEKLGGNRKRKQTRSQVQSCIVFSMHSERQIVQNSLDAWHSTIVTETIHLNCERLRRSMHLKQKVSRSQDLVDRIRGCFKKSLVTDWPLGDVSTLVVRHSLDHPCTSLGQRVTWGWKLHLWQKALIIISN